MKPEMAKEVEVKIRETGSGGTLRVCWKQRPGLAMANPNVLPL